MTSIDQIPAILDELEAIYDSSVANLRAALNAYARDGVRPDRNARDVGAFAYPELRIVYEPEGAPPSSPRAFARLNQPGIYASSIARPRLFRAYLAEQLAHLIRDYGVDVTVGRSASEISYPYVIDGAELELGGMHRHRRKRGVVARLVIRARLTRIGERRSRQSKHGQPEERQFCHRLAANHAAMNSR